VKYTKQHYVPSFYLKQFGDKLYCYDKLLDKTYRTSYRNLGFGKSFYDTKTSGKKFENFLKFLDQHFSRAYSQVLQKISLDIQDCYYFFLFLSCQWIRTTQFRNEMKSMDEQLKVKLKDSQLAKQLSRSHDTLKIQQMSFILEPMFKFADILSKKKWVIYLNDTNKPLWTSDNPIVLHNKLKYHGNIGLLAKGIEIHFPLTNHMVLVSFDTSTHRAKNYNLVSENVKHENFLQTVYASRFIYSINNDFTIAKLILKEKPEYRNPPSRGHIY